MKTKLAIFSLCLLPFFLKAEHMLGGFISYEPLLNGNYKFEMRLYRDCHSQGAEFDNPAAITIYRESGNNYYVLMNFQLKLVTRSIILMPWKMIV